MIFQEHKSPAIDGVEVDLNIGLWSVDAQRMLLARVSESGILIVN